MTSVLALRSFPSCQHIPICEEARGAGRGEACGAQAGGRGHRRDEGANSRADQAVLQPGGGHDPAAAQTAGLRLGAGDGSAHIDRY